MNWLQRLFRPRVVINIDGSVSGGSVSGANGLMIGADAEVTIRSNIGCPKCDGLQKKFNCAVDMAARADIARDTAHAAMARSEGRVAELESEVELKQSQIEVLESANKSFAKYDATLRAEVDRLTGELAASAVGLQDVTGQLEALKAAAKTPKQRLVIENQQLHDELGRVSAELTRLEKYDVAALSAITDLLDPDGKGPCLPSTAVEGVRGLQRELAIERRVSEQQHERLFDLLKEREATTKVVAITRKLDAVRDAIAAAYDAEQEVSRGTE